MSIAMFAARAALLPLALLGSAASQASQASPQAMQQTQNTQLATFAGGAHALAEACDANTPAELARMKADGRAAFAGRGMDAATYDRAFAAGYADTRARLAAASAQDRARGCAQLESMPKGLPSK